MKYADQFCKLALWLDRMCGYLDRGVRYFLIVFIGLIFTLLVVQVVMRYLIRSPLIWVEEVTSFVLAYLVMWACSSLVRNWQHIRVDTFVNAMPAKLKESVFFAVNILVIFFAYLLINAGHQLAQLGAGDLSASGIFHLYWPRMALVTGGVLIIAQAFNNLIRIISGQSKEII